MSRIALIGLDGSGKSANLEIMKMDKDYSSYQFLWVRWSPVLLKPLYYILNKKVKKNVKIDKSKERDELKQTYANKEKAKSKVFSYASVRVIWMLLATIDYFAQYHIKTFVWNIKRTDVIYDRFFLDLYIDQGVSFGYSPEKIRDLIKSHSWLFPKMDKYVYIRVSPQVCYERKDDIPNMDYLLKRFEIYELLAKEKNWVIINGEEPLEIVNKNIKEVVLGK